MQKKKAEIMDEGAMRRALTRIAFQIIEKNRGSKGILLAGVRTRGVPLAHRIADNIGEVEGFRPPVIELDISSLRDDLPRGSRPSSVFPDLPGLEGCTVILVDDVLFTGRTVDTGNFPSVRIMSAKTCPPRSLNVCRSGSKRSTAWTPL